MTTLPQTSPMRAPRVGGNGHLAMPIAHGPAPAPMASHAMTGADIWRVIRGNIWLILITLVIAAIIGFLANMWLLARHSRYTAAGLLVVHTPNEMPSYAGSFAMGADPATLEIELRTHAKRLTHEALLANVLENSDDVRKTEWFNQFVNYKDGKQVPDIQAAKEDLLEHLDVVPQANSRLIEVTMTYSIPSNCRVIVQAICQKYLNDAKNQQTGEQDDRLGELSKMVNNLEADIATKTRSRDDTASDMGLSGVSVNGNNAKLFELTALLDQRKDFLKLYNEFEWKLKHFQTEAANGSTPFEQFRAMNAEPELYQLREIVRNLQVEADTLSDRGEQSQAAKSARLRYEKYHTQLVELEATLGAKQREAILSDYEAMAQGAKKSLDQVQLEIAGLQKDIAALAKKEQTYRIQQEEVTTLIARRDKIKEEADKIGTIRANSKFNLIDWAQQPSTPDHPSFPKLWLVLSATMTIGLALSLGIAFLREMTDTTVRSPRDIARVGQMTLLGMIPHEADDPQVAGGRLALAIFDSPNSIIAEQFRHVRTRLQHASSLDTTRSILISGCSPEDGKTTVACNIAAGLALNGRRILLVDANFRRPQLHTVFAVGNETGFGDVLNNAEVFAQSVRETEVPNLSVMPSGNRPSNPTELLESQLLVDFIERALEEYDHVIFDSGPLLMVSDSIALAPRVDGVITVIRARGNSRGLLQRVRDELRRLKAEHLGVVLNAVRVQGGGYYGPMIKNYYAYQNR